jgi:polyhydroxybutyrate depolymerase
VRLVSLLLLTACASAPEGIEKREVGPQGAIKSYELYIPKSLAGPAPLVVALHRYTESGALMARMTGFNDLADREGFIVLYPNGPGRRFEFRDHEERDDGQVILSMIDDVARTAPVDRKRIYLTGASNGGFLAFRMACLYPRTFAAVAPVMALMPEELAEQEGPAVPMLVIHGTADSIVKEEAETLFGGRFFAVLPMSKTIQYWVHRNKAESPVVTILPDGDEDGTRTELRRYPGKAEVRYYRVENGGHTWPGGKERAPRFIVGRTARDWSATEEIWTFFRTYSR